MMSLYWTWLFSRESRWSINAYYCSQSSCFGEAQDEFLRMLCNYKKMQMQWLMLCKKEAMKSFLAEQTIT
jgi:hypothetical protein